MRSPALALAALVLTLVAVSVPAEACHGSVTTVSAPCGNTTCAVAYLVFGLAGNVATSNLAFYEESNGLAGLQRGVSVTLQGGHDDCYGGPVQDFRLF